MNARDKILQAVDAAIGAPRPKALIMAEAAQLLADPDAIRPALADPDLARAFAIKAGALGTTCDHIATLADLPAAVSRYLTQHGLASRMALQPTPALAALDWGGILTHADLAADEPVALGMARWGIAESGSLVIHSAPDNPILLSFLPLHHIVVLDRNDLLAHLDDYAARLSAGPQPRNAILITGPSGTTDIEGSYVRGAHGPGYLHVILVGES